MQTGSVHYLIRSFAIFFRIYPQNTLWPHPLSLNGGKMSGLQCPICPLMIDYAYGPLHRLMFHCVGLQTLCIQSYFGQTPPRLASFLCIAPDLQIWQGSMIGLRPPLCVKLGRFNFTLASRARGVTGSHLQCSLS